MLYILRKILFQDICVSISLKLILNAFMQKLEKRNILFSLSNQSKNDFFLRKKCTKVITSFVSFFPLILMQPILLYFPLQ